MANNQPLIEELMLQNREFAIRSWSLRETVELYGSDGSEATLLNNGKSIYPAKWSIYCGINKTNASGIKYCDQVVDSNGMKLLSFDCSWLRRDKSVGLTVDLFLNTYDFSRFTTKS